MPSPTAVAALAIDTPAPGADVASALARDTTMAATCGALAQLAASRTENAALATLLRDTAAYYDKLRRWRPDQPHPATDRPEAFHSFGRMLDRYVPAAAAAGSS